MDAMRERPSRVRFAVLAAVVTFQLACPLVIAIHGSDLAVGQFSTQSDAARYRTVARAHGTPYRDFDVEYPPAAYGLFRAIGSNNFDAFRERLFALQVACQALIVFLLFRFWGRRAMWSYLVLSAPMLFVVYNGFDLMAVAVTVAAATLVRRRHATAGALGFVFGAFLKVWPVVVLPVTLVRGKARAFGTAVVAGVLGLAAWTAWGGRSAAGDVLTFRGAKGWEYESVPGSLLRLVGRDALRFEAGSWRIGSPPWSAGALLTVVLATSVVAVWLLAWNRRDGLRDGLAETAAITCLLVFGTLLSPQFVIWPLPFVAMAAAAATGATRLERWASAAALLTLADWFVFNPRHPGVLTGELVILARNGALAGLLVAAVLDLRRAPTRAEPVLV